MKDALSRLLYIARNARSGPMFRAMASNCTGNVLDVGGWDFYKTAGARAIPYSSWTTLDADRDKTHRPDDPRVRVVTGDGCLMPFQSDSFDTVLCIQVLEHVFAPMAMVSEIERVLKPGGTAIFLIPQTSNVHMAPQHYYNFTRYWALEAMAGMEILRLEPLGGFWSSTASRTFFFFLQSVRCRRMSGPEHRRSPLFFVLLPFMWLFAAVLIPVSMLFSLADLSEEPNNHLFVVKKPVRDGDVKERDARGRHRL